LGDQCDVHTIDYPTREPLGYWALLGHALAKLPPTGRLVLLGESFSGPVAVLLAHALGPRAQALILCCSFVRNPRPWLSAGWPLARKMPLPPASVIARLLFGRFLTPARALILERALSTLSPAALVERLDAVVNVDVTAEFADIGVPMLCLQAAQDRLVPRSAADLICQLKPAARVMTFAGPHALLQALPEETAAAVTDFACQVCAPA
jgi:pimeloyl-[acyl-carrier protein] methyl ester esterase